jgi:hypothetical protein
MATADWSLAWGVLISVIATVASVLYYLRYKKWFLVSYIASISMFIFSIFYTWDILELKGIAVIVLLLLSTIIMIFLGKHFSGITLEEDKPQTSLPEKPKEKKKNINKT